MMTPQEVLKTYQCVDDPIAALLDLTEIAFIQADARAELLEQIERLREQTSQHWCDTECPNRRGDIAVLLETQKRLEKLRKLVEDIDCSDLLRHHPWDCPVLWAPPRGCSCECEALQQRINEALEP